MDKKTVRDVDLKGKRVLMRADFNVPLEGDEITDDRRIRAAMPTIEYILEHGASLILMSHLGRPKGEVKPALSLAPVAERLSELLEQDVTMAPDSIGAEVEALAAKMKPGDVMLLENTRFHAGEKANDAEYAKQLAQFGDIFVNDAFGAAHRAHASTVGVTDHLPAVGGFLIEKEMAFLGKAAEAPDHPYVHLLGGAKVSDKAPVIENLLGKADKILIGGGIANTFFKAMGYEVGASLVEDDIIDEVKEMLRKGAETIIVPIDVVVADAFENDANHKVVPVDGVAPGWMILDLGPETIEKYRGILHEAETVAWNGPLGVFEMPNFAKGTFAIAEALAELDAVTVVGGGESASAVEKAGVADEVSHVSTGGGASLMFFEGKTLPGLEALEDK